MINLLLAVIMVIQDPPTHRQIGAEEFARKVGIPLALSQTEIDRPQLIDSSFHYRTENPNYYHHNTTSSAGTIIDVVHFAMHDEANDSLTLKLLKYGFSAWMDTNLFVVAHEYGHISAFSKFGINMHPQLYVDGDHNGAVAPHKVFFGNLIGRPAVTIRNSEWAEVVNRFGTNTKGLALYTAHLDANGLNQEQLLTNRYVERYLDGKLSYLDSWPIIWGSFSTFFYPVNIENSDIDNYIANLEIANVSTSVGAVKGYSMLRLLSGSTLSAFSGLYKGLFSSSGGFVRPIRFSLGDADVYLPEFESFLCQTGPTIKTRLPIRIYGFSLTPSIEVSHGAEFGFKFVAPIAKPLTAHAAVYAHNQGYWVEGHIDLRIIKEAGLILGYERGSGYTFHKDVFGATNNNSEHSVIVGVDFNFKF